MGMPSQCSPVVELFITPLDRVCVVSFMALKYHNSHHLSIILWVLFKVTKRYLMLCISHAPQMFNVERKIGFFLS